MTKKFKVGLEIHVRVKTPRKLFSSAPNELKAEPNSNVDPVDIGLPGYQPMLNIDIIPIACNVCKRLNMDISPTISFDRKHYNYFDLPTGYQITQQANPIGKNGKIDVLGKTIQIRQLHIEQDAGKLTHKDGATTLDANRLGGALLEIVTAPCFDDYETLEFFLRLLVLDMKVNDNILGDLNEGALRIDVNISYTGDNGSNYTNRGEIKNLNSIRDVVRSVKEYIGQGIEHKEKVTLSYDSKTKQLKKTRSKEPSYRYLPEHNIPKIENEWIDTSESYIDTFNVFKSFLQFAKLETLIPVIKKKTTFYIAESIFQTCNKDKHFNKLLSLMLKYSAYLPEIDSRKDLKNEKLKQVINIMFMNANGEIDNKEANHKIKELV